MPTNPTTLDLDGLCPLLQVFDMPTSVKFYRDVLGFELVGNSPTVYGRDGDYFHWCMLRRGSTTIMLNTAYDEGDRPLAADAARVAAHSDTALYFGCPDVDALYSQLLPLGTNVLEKPNTTVYNMRRFTIAFHGAACSSWYENWDLRVTPTVTTYPSKARVRAQ